MVYGSSEDGGNRPGPESCGRTGCQRYRFYWSGYYYFQKQIVRGLTTAAGIWATSGIGLAIGAGMYWLGISATILTLIGLEALSYLLKYRYEKFHGGVLYRQ